MTEPTTPDDADTPAPPAEASSSEAPAAAAAAPAGAEGPTASEAPRVDIPVTAPPPAVTEADEAVTREVTASPEPAVTQQAPSSPPTVPYPPAPTPPAPPPAPPTYAAAPPGYPTAPPTGAAQPPAGGYPGHPTTGSQPAAGQPGYPTTGSQPAVGMPAAGYPGYPTTGSQPAAGYPGYPTNGSQPAVGYPGYPSTGSQPAVGYGAAGPYGPQAPPAPPGYPPSGAYPPGFGPAPRRVNTEAGGRRALLAVAVVLAVLAGGFAVVNLRATPTGAGSPEGAVEQFFDAVADEDLVGVLEMLDPGERSVLLPFVRSLASELDRLELTSGFDPDDVGGFDIEVDGLETSPQELGPGVTEVAITAGVFRAETEPETVPVGDVLRDIVEANGGRIDVPREQEQGSIGADDGIFLVATETDGRWHLSLGFTIAEYARRDAGYEIPDLTGGVEPQGAASPEEAVRGMVDAAVALDLERVISLLPPDEMRALQVYAPLFLEDAQDDLDDFRVDEDFDVTVDRLDLDTTEVGEGTRVVPTGGAFTMRDESGESTLSYEDGCLEITGDAAEDFEDEFGQNRVCTDELAETDGNLSEEDEADLQALGELFSGFEPGVMTVERDGRWYVDPIRTVGDVGLQVLAGIEKEDLEEGGILYRLFTGDVFDAGFGYPDFEADDEFESDGCDIWDSEDGDC